MKNLKIKIITGYRKDQHYTIEADEAHKAYYLFLNPEKRGIFKDGLALIGNEIKGIEPDYNATMGWNPTYTIGDEDWNEIKQLGIDRELRDTLQKAKDIAYQIPNNPNLLNKPLETNLLGK